MTTTLLVVAQNEIEGMRAIMPKVDRAAIRFSSLTAARPTELLSMRARWATTSTCSASPGYARLIGGVATVRGEWVVTFSPDGTSPPEDIPQLIAKAAEGHDMVIASRYLGDARSEDDDVVTAFGNWLFTSVIYVLYRWHYTDAMTIFRIYRSDLFYALALDQDLDLPPLRADVLHAGVASIRSSARVALAAAAHDDIACPEPPRIGGERKLQVIRRGRGYMTQVVCDRFRKSEP